jgi:amino acid transporter
VSKIPAVLKRLVLGRPFRSDRLSHTLLPKRLALPIFASDALSSVAYAPEEIFLTLSVSGLSAYALAPWIGVAVALVMLVVVASYRQNVHAYPSGGGDYEVASTNLGGKFGLTVASALLVDYVLTVAVSTSSGVANIGSAIPFVAQHKVLFAVVIVAVLAALNLRGVRESGKTFAIPTYGFIIGIFGMVIWGLFQASTGTTMRAESANFDLHAEQSLTGFAFVFLILRSFSSGAAALTGVEAISNGVPAFRKPKSKNAATTLLMMGLLAVTMLVGIIALANLTKVNFAEDPTRQLIGAPAGYEQKTIVSQIAKAVFPDFSPAFYYISFSTGIILLLAANTAFNGFPVLASILARDRYLPRQLRTRGDRLTFSNGIVFLALFALVLIFAFDAEVTRLIQLYIVGVFVSFTVSQAGMIRHWNRLLTKEKDPAVRRRMRRSQTVNTVGLIMTGTVLIIVLITKFLLGAWIAIAAMVAIFLLMTAIRRHYDRVSSELSEIDREPAVLPSRNHAIVLVSTLHLPTLRALVYAKAVHPDVLEAVTVNVDDAETRKLVEEWEQHDFTVPLKVIESPYREITRPVLDYVKRVRGDNPRNVVTVFIPEYVVGRWWEQILHNQSALRLKGRLLFQPGVMVTSVPWQLQSSERAKELPDRAARPAAGDVRRGFYGGQRSGMSAKKLAEKDPSHKDPARKDTQGETNPVDTDAVNKTVGEKPIGEKEN